MVLFMLGLVTGLFVAAIVVLAVVLWAMEVDEEDIRLRDKYAA